MTNRAREKELLMSAAKFMLMPALQCCPSFSKLVSPLQELLESPHLTLELASLIETLPKNLDKVMIGRAVRKHRMDLPASQPE